MKIVLLGAMALCSVFTLRVTPSHEKLPVIQDPHKILCYDGNMKLLWSK